jgi:hypothetical protein
MIMLKYNEGDTFVNNVMQIRAFLGGALKAGDKSLAIIGEKRENAVHEISDTVGRTDGDAEDQRHAA